MMSIESEAKSDLTESEQASTKKMMSFSFGILISNWIGYTFAIFVFYFYEVEVGLPVVLVGLALILFFIWNAINDPLVGYLTDKPFKWTKKWGMRFPWIMIGVFPTLLFWFLIFTPPDVDPDNPWLVFLYLVIVICLLDLFYSLFTINLNASYTTNFRTDAERRKATLFMNMISPIGSFLLNLIVPLFYVYGDRSTIILAELIIVLILGVCVIPLVPGIRESEELKEMFLRGFENVQKESFWKTMKFALQRKNFMVVLLVFMLMSIAWNLYLGSMIYFIKDILKMPYSIAIYIQLASFIGFIGFIPFWAWSAKKLGHAKTMKLGILLIAIALTPSLWISTLEEAILFAFLVGIAFGSFIFMIGPIIADVNDEVTILSGRHQEALLAGIRTFFFRIAIIFQVTIITVIHIITAYNPDPKAIQTPLAITGIRIHMALIPCLLVLMGFFIMLIWYDLEGEKKITVKQKLKEMGL